MWIWYIKVDETIGYTTTTFAYVRAVLGRRLRLNESCMMIPGTYAEMRADYD
jgi:hypothetical protein